MQIKLYFILYLYTQQWAASCVSEVGKKIYENNLQLAFGQPTLMGEALHQSNVFRTILHPLFNIETYENDIAIVFLENQLKISSNLLPICLPTVLSKFNSSGIVIGYEEKSSEKSIRELSVEITGNRSCFGDDEEFYDKFLRDDKFCGNSQPIQVCNDELGSGLVTKVGESWFLRGITSIVNTGNSQNSCHGPAIFSSVRRHLTWIEETIELNSN